MISLKKIFFIFAVVNSVAINANVQKGRLRLNQEYNKKVVNSGVETEVAFGTELAATILGRYKLVKNKRLNEYISKLGAGIAAYFGRDGINYNFAIIKSNTINAYACPGGYIFITDKAIKTMKNEAQLVGVLAHEMAHVNKLHIVKQFKLKDKDDSFSNSMAILVGGGVTGIVKAIDQGFGVLFEKGLKVRDEFEADSVAIDMMVKLNYDWHEYRNFLKVVGKTITKKDVLHKTHPPMKMRISTLEKHVLEHGYNKYKGKVNESRFKKIIKI